MLKEQRASHRLYGLNSFMEKRKDLFNTALLCLILCYSMDCTMPGFPVLHHLLELAQTHIHQVSDAIQLSHPLLSPFFACPQSVPASDSFLMSLLVVSGGQSFGASASVLPMNIQGWFPLGLTRLISLQSKGLSRVFSNTTVQKHQLF